MKMTILEKFFMFLHFNVYFNLTISYNRNVNSLSLFPSQPIIRHTVNTSPTVVDLY